MAISESYGALRRRIDDLRQVRGEAGKIFLIEHGLSPVEFDELRGVVAQGLRRSPLSYMPALSHDWQSNFIPLAVVATEVGYRYGTGGNEYWPCLAETLGVPFGNLEDMRALADGFRRLRAYTGVKPADTTWARHFRLIAWPIAHAVLPVWLHEPLLEAINVCPHRLDDAPDASDAEFLDWLRAYAVRVPKLATFLEQDDTAQAIVRGVLGRTTGGHFSKDLLERFLRDIQARPRSKALLRQAVVTHGPRPPKPGRRTERPKATAALAQRRTAKLSLVVDATTPALELLPVGDDFDVALDRVRVRLIGMGRVVSLGATLRFGGRLEIPVLPDGEFTPLVSSEDLRSLEKSMATKVGAIALDTRDPLVFLAAHTGVDRAHQSLDQTFDAVNELWVLTKVLDATPPDAVRERPMVAGWHCYEVDATHSDGRCWLTSRGLTAVSTPVVDVIGTPSFDPWRGVAGPLLAGDLVALSIVNGPVELANVAELGTGLHLLDLSDVQGDAPLRFSQAGMRDATVPVTVLDQPPARERVVSIELDGPAFSVRALVQQTLSLRIIGAAPLAGLRVTLKLKRNDVLLARTHRGPLASLPALVRASDPAWSMLLSTVHLDESEGLVLEADVDGLASRSWSLEAATICPQPEEATGTVLYMSDAPFSPATQDVERRRATYVVQPLAGEDLLVGAGVCRRGVESTLTLPQLPPARVLRRVAGSGRALGAATLCRAYTTWATSASADIIAEAHRHSVALQLDAKLAAVLCGDVWAQAERMRAESAEDLGELVATQLYNAGVARDDYLESQLGAVKESVSRSMIANLGQKLAAHEFWLSQVAARGCDAAAACDALASMITASYRTALMLAALPSGEWSADVACCESDVITAIDKALKAWNSHERWTDGLSLLLPISLRARLETIDYGAADDAWVVADLRRAIRELGSKWPDTDVSALYALWVRPRQLTRVVDLRRALNDRLASRVLRYAAVRRREAIGVRL